MMWCSGKRVELAEVAIKMGLQLLGRFYRNPLNRRKKADPESGNERGNSVRQVLKDFWVPQMLRVIWEKVVKA